MTDDPHARVNRVSVQLVTLTWQRIRKSLWTRIRKATPESRLWVAGAGRGQGEPRVGERQYTEVLAVRSEAGRGALRNRTARSTKKCRCEWRMRFVCLEIASRL